MPGDYSAEFKREVFFNDKEWPMSRIWEAGKNCKDKEKGIFWRDAYDCCVYHQAIKELIPVVKYYKEKREQALMKIDRHISEGYRTGEHDGKGNSTPEFNRKLDEIKAEATYWTDKRIEPQQKLEQYHSFCQSKIKFHLEIVPSIVGY